jgi:hypothetical protein
LDVRARRDRWYPGRVTTRGDAEEKRNLSAADARPSWAAMVVLIVALLALCTALALIAAFR